MEDQNKDDFFSDWPQLFQTLETRFSKGSKRLPLDPNGKPIRNDVEFTHWEFQKKDGGDLEPALRSGAIALVDAQWLVQFYYENVYLRRRRGKRRVVATHNNHQREEENTQEDVADVVEVVPIPYRQRLPPEAFLTCDQIIYSASGLGAANIIALSHLWLQPNHPDPQGTTLELLARHCKQRLQKDLNQGCVPRWAVFWDFCSLHQHPDPSRGLYRTEQESKSFAQGLETLARFYSHSETTICKVTQFPPGYPQGYHIPPGANVAQYNERGWPILESHLAGLIKPAAKVQDISIVHVGNGSDDHPSHQATRRSAPLSTLQFEECMERASFTNAKDDREVVIQLYQKELDHRLGQLIEWDLSGLQWGDDDLEQLARVLGPDYTPNLKRLSLANNEFGPVGCQALACALFPKEVYGPLCLPSLEELNLSQNPRLGEEDSIQALAGTLICIKDVKLSDSKIGRAACQSLAEAMESAHLCRQLDGVGTNLDPFLLERLLYQHLGLLHYLDLSHNPDIGTEGGMQWLASLAAGHLSTLSLEQCGLDVAACRSLAQAAAATADKEERKLGVRLRSLNLCGNYDIGSPGVEHISTMAVQNVWNLYLDDCHIGSDGYKALADAAECCFPHSPLSLVSFSRSNNDDWRLDPEGLGHLCRLVANCGKLGTLRIHGCQLSSEDQQKLEASASSSGSPNRRRFQVETTTKGLPPTFF